MHKKTSIQYYIGEFYSDKKHTLYYEPKLANPLGKFAKKMYELLWNGDVVGFQKMSNEMQRWRGKKEG